jgi:hypothetical protein
VEPWDDVQTEIARLWPAPDDRFPRPLDQLIPLVLPVGIVAVADLRPRTVADWLARLGVTDWLVPSDRRLAGCLIAARGHGLILVNSDLDPAEQRFTLAHEVAHFCLDYQRPRQRALAALGPAGLEILDGARPPTPAERITALLHRVTLGLHLHLLDPWEGAGTPDWLEERANRFALALLAPAAAVWARLDGPPDRGLADRLAALLTATFGLPAGPARLYAARLAAQRLPSPLVAALRARQSVGPPPD